MINLVDRVYLDIDFRANADYDYVIASGRWFKNPIITSIDRLKIQALDFEDMMASHFGNDTSYFWRMVLGEKNKLVFYLDPKDIVNLMIEYWKSIYGNMSEDGLYVLYKSMVDTELARSLMTNLNEFEGVTRYDIGRKNLFKLLTKDEFKKIAKNISPSDELKLNLRKGRIGVEYLLGHYLAKQGECLNTKNELSKRLLKIYWDIYLAEIKTLKMDTLTLGWNVFLNKGSKILTEGLYENKVKRTPEISWITDPLIGVDEKYTREKLTKEMFLTTYTTIMTGMSSDKDTINTDTKEFRGLEHLLDCLYNDDGNAILNAVTTDVFNEPFYKDRYLTRVNFFMVTNLLRWNHLKDETSLSEYELTLDHF